MKRIIAAATLLVSCSCAQAAVLKQEPPEGALKSGQRVLVDDGTCPPGQIKQVIGGGNRSQAGQLVSGKTRQVSCIRR
ncbi:MAG TPA: DUF6719 family protein [Xanthobacteraceae bacterium]